jgi:hypothetical protein
MAAYKSSHLMATYKSPHLMAAYKCPHLMSPTIMNQPLIFFLLMNVSAVERYGGCGRMVGAYEVCDWVSAYDIRI